MRVRSLESGWRQKPARAARHFEISQLLREERTWVTGCAIVRKSYRIRVAARHVHLKREVTVKSLVHGRVKVNRT